MPAYRLAIQMPDGRKKLSPKLFEGENEQAVSPQMAKWLCENYPKLAVMVMLGAIPITVVPSISLGSEIEKGGAE